VRVGLAEIITSESRLDAARRRQERDKAA
jgi:hypothetical protein